MVLALLACGCQSVTPVPSRYGQPERRRPDEIAYTCSNNARLCQAFLADLNSKSLSEIRFFIAANGAAWLETAAALKSSS